MAVADPIPAPPSSDAREYPTRPWVGIGVIVWRGDDILIVRRAKAPRLGEWSIPGGAVCLGETVFAAAIREVREETGIAVKPLEIITVVDAVTPDEAGRVRFHYTLVEIGATYVTGELKSGDDVSHCRFVPVAEAMQLIAWDKTRDLIALAARMRG